MKKYNRMTKGEAWEYFGTNTNIQRELEEHGRKVSRQYISQWGGKDNFIPFSMQNALIKIIEKKPLRKTYKIEGI